MGDNAFLDNIYFAEDSLVGISENTISHAHLDIYPNPNAGKFVVSFDSFQKEAMTIELSDLLGRVLIRTKKNTSIGNNSVPVNAENLSSGIYNVRILSNGLIDIKELIIE